MATRKQRRRRAKELRHEWEYVYVDEEGREVEVEEDVSGGEAKKPEGRSGAKPGTRNGARSKRSGAWGGRTVQPPSWNRVGKRALLFAPVMFIIIHLLSRDLSLEQKVVQTIVLLGFFIPFSYLMDTVMYRTYRKRIGDPVKPREKIRRNQADPGRKKRS